MYNETYCSYRDDADAHEAISSLPGQFRYLIYFYFIHFLRVLRNYSQLFVHYGFQVVMARMIRATPSHILT